MSRLGCLHSASISPCSTPYTSPRSLRSCLAPNKPSPHPRQLQLLSTAAQCGGLPNRSASLRQHHKPSSSSRDANETSQDEFQWPAEVQPGDMAPDGHTDSSSSSFSSERSFASSSSSSSSPPPPWAAQMPTWNASTRKHMHHMMDLFTLADMVRLGFLGVLLSTVYYSQGECRPSQLHLFG